MARKIAAIAVLIAASPVLFFAARTMAATSLVPPVAYLSPETPTSDLGVLAQAQGLAPGEAFFPYFEAQVHQARMRSDWILAAAPEHGARASAAVARAISLAPTNPMFHLLSGAIYTERARLARDSPIERSALVSKGAESLERAVEQSPSSPLVAQSAGLTLLQVFSDLEDAQRQRALDLLLRAAADDNANLADSFNILRTVVAPGDLVALARRITPNTGPGRATLAAFLVETGRSSTGGIAAGLEEYIAAAVLLDLNLSLLMRATVVAEQAPIAAQQTLRRRLLALIATHESVAESWFALALVEQILGDDTGHRTAINRALERMDASAVETRVEILRDSANAWQRAEAFDAALDDMEAAQVLDPREPMLLIDIGRLLDQLGRSEEALTRFVDAARIAPGSQAARQALAEAYLARFDFLDAIEQWQAIIARDRAAIGPRLQIARAYTSLGLRDQATRYYTEILDLQPGHETARREMEELTRRQREFRP